VLQFIFYKNPGIIHWHKLKLQNWGCKTAYSNCSDDLTYGRIPQYRVPNAGIALIGFVYQGEITSDVKGFTGFLYYSNLRLNHFL